MTDLINGDYTAQLKKIKDHVRSAQYQALKAVNSELIGLYWNVGQLIVERQQTKGWGVAIVDRITDDVRLDFPGLQGFSVRNLPAYQSLNEAANQWRVYVAHTPAQ